MYLDLLMRLSFVTKNTKKIYVYTLILLQGNESRQCRFCILFFSAPHPKCYSFLVYLSMWIIMAWYGGWLLYTCTLLNSCSVFCTQFNIKVINVGQTLHKKIFLFFFCCISYDQLGDFDRLQFISIAFAYAFYICSFMRIYSGSILEVIF